MIIKEKASVSVAKPNTLALAFNFGGLAEWLNAADCKSVNGAGTTVRGFESLTRRHFSSPVKAGTSTREKNRTAKAARSRKISIGFSAVKNKEISRCISSIQENAPKSFRRL